MKKQLLPNNHNTLEQSVSDQAATQQSQSILNGCYPTVLAADYTITNSVCKSIKVMGNNLCHMELEEAPSENSQEAKWTWKPIGDPIELTTLSFDLIGEGNMGVMANIPTASGRMKPIRVSGEFLNGSPGEAKPLMDMLTKAGYIKRAFGDAPIKKFFLEALGKLKRDARVVSKRGFNDNVYLDESGFVFTADGKGSNYVAKPELVENRPIYSGAPHEWEEHYKEQWKTFDVAMKHNIPAFNVYAGFSSLTLEITGKPNIMIAKEGNSSSGKTTFDCMIETAFRFSDPDHPRKAAGTKNGVLALATVMQDTAYVLDEVGTASAALLDNMAYDLDGSDKLRSNTSFTVNETIEYRNVVFINGEMSPKKAKKMKLGRDSMSGEDVRIITLSLDEPLASEKDTNWIRPRITQYYGHLGRPIIREVNKARVTNPSQFKAELDQHNKYFVEAMAKKHGHLPNQAKRVLSTKFAHIYATGKWLADRKLIPGTADRPETACQYAFELWLKNYGVMDGEKQRIINAVVNQMVTGYHAFECPDWTFRGEIVLGAARRAANAPSRSDEALEDVTEHFDFLWTESGLKTVCPTARDVHQITAALREVNLLWCNGDKPKRDTGKKYGSRYVVTAETLSQYLNGPDEE